MVNTNYATGSLIGAKFNETHTEAKFTPGQVAHGNNGSVWMYVLASASIVQYDAVRIDSDFKIGQITIDTAKQACSVGFAQLAFNTAEYGWVMLAGKPLVRLASDCDQSLALYCTANGGIVDDATVSSMIQGLVATVSVTAGAVTAATCVANFPTIQRSANLTQI